MSLISARHISVCQHGTTLVNDVTCHVDAGEVVAVIGPNGAGKTSLVRALTLDLPVSEGDVFFKDKPLRDYELEDRACQLAILPQHSELNFPFSVRDVVQLGRIPHASGQKEDQLIVSEALQAMDMLQHADKLYTWLSGGEQQRVQLARVFAQIWRVQDAKERLLILDEPTASLDVAHTQQLMRTIRRQTNNGAGIIMIVHDFNLAARYADRILLMKDSKLQLDGSPDTVINENTMQQYFNIKARILSHPENGRPVVFIND